MIQKGFILRNNLMHGTETVLDQKKTKNLYLTILEYLRISLLFLIVDKSTLNKNKLVKIIDDFLIDENSGRDLIKLVNGQSIFQTVKF